MSGFEYISSSWLIALGNTFPTGNTANNFAEAYHEFGKTIVPEEKKHKDNSI